MKRALIIAAIAAALPFAAAAAQKAQSPAECEVFTNMVFAAHVHARHGIAELKTREMFRELYAGLYKERDAEEMDNLVRRVVRAAFNQYEKSPRYDSRDYAVGLRVVCMTNEGDMDPFLGRESLSRLNRGMRARAAATANKVDDEFIRQEMARIVRELDRSPARY